MLVGCDVIRNDQFKLRAFAGPSLSYLFRIDKNKFGNKKNTYHLLTAGINLGLGLDFYPLIFDFHYEWGLNNYYRVPEFKANKYIFTLGFILDK